MLKFKLTLLLVSLLSLIVSAQTPQPTATPIELDNEVVKISTDLIQIDVTVTDKKGNPISDLKAEDFEVYENGKKQKITNFSFISNRAENKTNSSNRVDKAGIQIPSPTTKIESKDVRRTFALIVDDLSLSFESTYQVKRALRNFVEKQMQAGDLVAILKTGSGIGALQQFTADKNRLYKAIEKIRWNLRGSGQVSAFRPFSAAGGDFDSQSGTGGDDAPIAESGIDDFRSDFFATGTLGAIQYVVNGMERLPGRKSAILFSDGFQIFSRGDSNFTGSSRVFNALSSLVESANRAAVVIYTMDARGLQTLNFTAADDFGSQPTGVTQRSIEGVLRDRRDSFSRSQDGINYLAKETGGFSIRNTNDLKGGIKRVLNDQSYYLIAYEPQEDTFDAEKRRYNKLDVRVRKDNVNVRYRSGFFGISDAKIKKPAELLTGDEKIVDALVSPFAVNDINMSLSTVFKGDIKNNLYLDSYVHINSEDLAFKDSEDGRKQASFDILVANFGDNGAPTDQFSKTFTINVKGRTYEKIMKDGFVYNFTLPVKKPGAYQIRISIRDRLTDKVGSASQFTEVPKLKKKRLLVSGIVVDNISYKQWNALQNNDGVQMPVGNDQYDNDLTAMTDTALRRFKSESVLRYALEIYNFKTNSQKNPELFLRTRVFRDNKLLYEGKDIPVGNEKSRYDKIKPASGAINLSNSMTPGNYILQVIVTDKLAKKKRQIATQFLEFEIVK